MIKEDKEMTVEETTRRVKNAKRESAGWLEGFTDHPPVGSDGWLEGFTDHPPAGSEGWVEGMGKRSPKSKGWIEGYGDEKSHRLN